MLLPSSSTQYATKHSSLLCTHAHHSCFGFISWFPHVFGRFSLAALVQPHLQSHVRLFGFDMCAGGKYTGAALNPARVIGPMAVFRCGMDVAWIYILAQLFAAFVACCIFAFVSGLGPLNPLTSQKKLGLTYREAVFMWITGE